MADSKKCVALVGKDIAQARRFSSAVQLFHSKKGFGLRMVEGDNLSRIFNLFEIWKPAFIFFHADIRNKNPEALDVLIKATNILLPATKVFEFNSDTELRILVMEEIRTMEAANGNTK